jgi:hypothetical protein
MKPKSADAQLKSDLRRLEKSMDFVSEHPALRRNTKEAERYAEIYQQLGLAWEFLALKCRHQSGWRKASGGNLACKICGLIKDLEEPWVLVPRAKMS